MTAFVFISGIHRTNGSDNEQLFGKSHSLFAAPKAKPSPSQGKAGIRGVACGTPRRYAAVCSTFSQLVGTRCADRHHGLWHVGWSISITVCTHFNVDLKLFSLWMCTVCFMYFLFTAVLLTVRIWYVFVFDMPIFVSTFHWTLFDIFYLNNETAAVISIWMFLIALSVLLIYNFLSTPINEMFLLSRVLCVFSICIFISINKHVCIQ